MSGNLSTGRYCKHENTTKKFLEETSTLIELCNFMENVRLGKIKLCDPCIYNENIETCKNEEQADKRAFAALLQSDARRQLPRRLRAASSRSRAAERITKTNEAKPRQTFDLKCLHSEVKDTNLKREPIQCSPIRHSSPPSSKKDKYVSTKSKETRMKRQIEASNIDTAKCLQYLLKKISSHEKAGKTSIALLPKKYYSTRSLNTWKSFSSISDTFLFSKACMKQKSNKRDTLRERQLIKDADSNPSLKLKMNSKPSLRLKMNSKPSLQLKMNIQLNSNSNSVNFKIRGWSSSMVTDRSASTPSAQTSNDREIHLLKPYAKTHAVYVCACERPYGKMKGIRSHVTFNVNIGGSPPQTPRSMHSDEARPLTAPPSARLVGRRQALYNTKVNFDRGSTSLQQSFSLGRSGPQSESPYETDNFSRGYCECANSDRTSVADTQQVPICEHPCCQANTLQRTRQRIMDRVGTDPYRGSTTFSPFGFLKKCYDKYICNKEEEQTRSVGSCTCSPFMETDKFSVEEADVNPDCSFLKRMFGQLLYNDKCIVCTQEKRVGTKYHHLKPYECEPGTCEEKKDLFACIKKYCDKWKAKKAKEKKAKEKKKKKEQRLKQIKKKKEQRQREKLQGTRRSSFITSIFKSQEEDDDRQMLLPDEVKKRKQKDRDEKEGKGKDRKGKGRDEGTSELGDKAKKTFAVTRRGYRRLTRRIRERYYRNKKMAEEQKGQYSCDFYLMSLRTKPCLWVYYMCPVCYPYCLQVLNVWRQVSDLLLFFVAIVVWSPCILCAECLKVIVCNIAVV